MNEKSIRNHRVVLGAQRVPGDGFLDADSGDDVAGLGDIDRFTLSGVHAHQSHVAALAEILSRSGIPVAIHAFLDGRDVGPMTARDQVRDFLADIAGMPNTGIATLCGRFYAMDRDKRWERVEKAFRLLTDGEGEPHAGALSAIEASYDSGIGDEFVEPVALNAYAGMMDGDGLICWNFRADRAREILLALLDPDFSEFDVEARPDFAATLGMVSYSDRHDAWLPAMFPPEEIINTLGEWMAVNGKRQLRLAETEKYPHVTFFLNGGIEDPDPSCNPAGEHYCELYGNHDFARGSTCRSKRQVDRM